MGVEAACSPDSDLALYLAAKSRNICIHMHNLSWKCILTKHWDTAYYLPVTVLSTSYKYECISILEGTEWLSNLPTVCSAGEWQRNPGWLFSTFVLLMLTFCGFFSGNILGSRPFWSLPLQSCNNSAGRPALRHPSSNFRVGFSWLQSRPLTDSVPNPITEASLGEHKRLLWTLAQ